MAKVGEQLLDPNDTIGIVDTLNRVIQVVDDAIEFGDPNDPYVETSGTKATGASTTHNGRISNIRGSWVEAEFDSAGATATFTHNLNLPVFSASEPNVRWLFTNFSHSGAGPGAATTAMSLLYEGGTVATNSIVLRLMVAAGTRTIASGANAVKVCAFFTPAVRWP